MDVKETISIDGGLVRDTAQIQNTDAAWLISLWHDETAVYEPETECKPYILTIQMEGQPGLEEVGERAIEVFASVVAR